MFQPALVGVVAAITTASLYAGAVAQPEPKELAAFVTVVGGAGAVRLETEPPVRITVEEYAFDPDKNRIGVGEGVGTEQDGSAVLILPDYAAVVYLEGSSELRIVEPAMPGSGIDLIVRITSGRAWVIRKPGNERWLLIAGGSDDGTASPGYTLSKGASLFVEADSQGVSFAVRSGEGRFFRGQIPAAVLIDASGQLVDRTGELLAQGLRVSTREPGGPAADADAGTLVADGLRADTDKFALAQSDDWLKEAERGDFTPVRGSARAAPQLLAAAKLGESATVYEPRMVFAAPAPRAAPSPVRVSLSQSLALLESGVPGSVLAGQRFRRSRIIGNPGTGGTGALIVNPAAELQIKFGR